jgi:hypothetical protein
VKVSEDLAGDGRADFEIAVCEQGAIDSEAGQDVVDDVHGILRKSAGGGRTT